MFYTYVLESLKDHKRYIGSTSSLEKRLIAHNSGLVTSTKSRRPFKLIYQEDFPTQNEARWRERSFKRSHDLLERVISREKQLAAGPEGLWPGGR